MARIWDFWIFWWAPSGILSLWRRIWPNPSGADFAGSTGWPKSSSFPRALSYFLRLCWLLFNQLFKTQLRDFPSISKSLRLCEKSKYIRKRSTGEATDWNDPVWRGGMGCSWPGGKREVWGMGNKLIFMYSGATLPFPAWLRRALQADLEAGFWGD